MADIIYIHNDINKAAYRASEQRETEEQRRYAKL